MRKVFEAIGVAVVLSALAKNPIDVSQLAANPAKAVPVLLKVVEQTLK